jgi:hypothetical protein
LRALAFDRFGYTVRDKSAVYRIVYLNKLYQNARYVRIKRAMTLGYLPIQNLLKITPSRSSEVNSPVIELS